MYMYWRDGNAAKLLNFEVRRQSRLRALRDDIIHESLVQTYNNTNLPSRRLGGLLPDAPLDREGPVDYYVAVRVETARY